MRNLRERFPDATIDFLTEEFAGDVVRGNPWLSGIITFNRHHTSGFGLLRNVRRRRYDLVIDLFVNPRTALLTRCSGARLRVGFPFRFRTYAYNVIVESRSETVHNVDFNLDTLRRLSIAVPHRDPHFPLDDKAERYAADWMANESGGRKIVGLNPGGGWVTKLWGAEHYAALGDAIVRSEGAAVLLFWGPGEEGAVEDIRRKMRSVPIVLPKTSLKELGSFIRRCSAFVSNDSGPMHIAAALGVPTLGIFGPTRPHAQGPLGRQTAWVRKEELTCLGCNLTKCPIGTVCMTQLDVDRVFAAYQSLHSTVQ